jgi:hypothetical protein
VHFLHLNAGQYYPESNSFWLTGVYTAEVDSCLCHTIGAGAANVGSIAYGNGNSFHPFNGTHWTFGLAVNGTSSVTMDFKAHTDW